jgi:hypothetical protein
MDEEPKPGTIGAIKRSTEEEFRAFKKMLDNLMITPERVNRALEKQLEIWKKEKK